MIYAPNMLLIGAAGRDAGKTTFACSLIQHFHGLHVQAAKVTTIQEQGGTCPRGGEGCGVCTSLQGNYCITEETECGDIKDTQRLLAAGATRVLWLRVLKEHLAEGASALIDTLGNEAPIICESNSLRLVVRPGIFLMLRHRDAVTVKQSADAVLSHADETIMTDGNLFDFDMNRLIFRGKKWGFSTSGDHPASNFR